jgi:acetylornithine deacetylase/succinyl-diaminopimelate desuccinylase-like protein
MTAGAGPEGALAFVSGRWPADVQPLLEEYARIPGLSPAFDAGWEAHGLLSDTAELLADWARRRPLPGAAVEVVRIPGLTPTVVVDVPATDAGATGTVLVYGHYDKQPPFDGWTQGRGPWTPVVDGEWLYARGVADDGYALPSTLLALEAVRATGGRHARCIVMAEGSEESGSPHLRAVLDHLADRIGTPDLILALDSGSPTYDRLWVTTSLRGIVVGSLTVRVLEHGVHSGEAGAVVPSSFRIARLLLDRIEDPATGDLLLPELVVDPPEGAAAAAGEMAGAVRSAGLEGPGFPVVEGLALQGADAADQALRVAWKGSVAVVGADGLPPSGQAGNVLRPFTTLRLAIRLPPTADPEAAATAVARALTSDPPYGATVEWTDADAAGGWAAPPLAPWLSSALSESSLATFGHPSGQLGEGGTIPFMGWLADQFPGAQILALGVLGPGSNAHGPDEGLHLPTAHRITASLALLVDAHARHAAGPHAAGRTVSSDG